MSSPDSWQYSEVLNTQSYTPIVASSYVYRDVHSVVKDGSCELNWSGICTQFTLKENTISACPLAVGVALQRL